MDKDLEIKILKQQIRDLKNKLFERDLIQPRDYRENIDLEYPEETEGSKIAAEIRAVCNNLSNEEREMWRQKALDIIYKDCPEQDPRKWADEEKMMDSLFGGNKKTWRGHKLYWCKLCDTAAISLNCCHNGSCTGTGCEICCSPEPGADSTDFSRLTKSHPEAYLNKEEIKTKRKIELLRKYIIESLAAGFNEINWKYLHESRNTCDLAYDLFDELKEYKNKVIPASQELKDKMKRLAARPPVTFEQAKKQVDNTHQIK